jgi:hypothetical protein
MKAPIKPIAIAASQRPILTLSPDALRRNRQAMGLEQSSHGHPAIRRLI